MAVIEAKKQEIIHEVENQGQQSLQRLGIQRNAIEQKVQKIETGIEKRKTLLQRSTSPEIAQLDKTLKTIFPEEVRLKNNKWSVTSKVFDDLFSWKTNHYSRKQSLKESDLSKPSFPRLVHSNQMPQFEGEQCYGECDCVTVEIRTQQGQDCATKARVEDNKDGSYAISYFAKETGKCKASVKVNEEHIHGSPFYVHVKARKFRCVLSFGQQGSAAGMLSKPVGVAVNDRDEIAVTEAGNNRVQLFSSDGTYL